MVERPVGLGGTTYLSPDYQNKIFAGAVSPVYDHPIVLLHDGSQGNYRQNTVNTLQRIIDSYRSRGYVFTDPLGRSLGPHRRPDQPSGCGVEFCSWTVGSRAGPSIRRRHWR